MPIEVKVTQPKPGFFENAFKKQAKSVEKALRESLKNPFRKKYFKISINAVDFGMLVHGKAVTKSSNNGDSVQIILQDIGFDTMKKLIKVARQREKKANKKKSQKKA